MRQIPERISPSQRVLLPGPTASSLIQHRILSTGSDGCERAALEKELSALVGLCPSFAQEPLLCSGPCHSPELCCRYTCARFNTFLILALNPAHWLTFWLDLRPASSLWTFWSVLLAGCGYCHRTCLGTVGQLPCWWGLCHCLPCCDCWLLKEQPVFLLLHDALHSFILWSPRL